VHAANANAKGEENTLFLVFWKLMLWVTQKAGSDTGGMVDPVLPAKFGKLVPLHVLSQHVAPLEPWEFWMNSCGFKQSSPVRPFIKDLFSGQVAEKLLVVFDAFSQWGVPPSRPNTLTLEQLLHFSKSIKGSVHVMLHTDRNIPIRQPPESELQWIRDHFSVLFTDAHPLDQSTFRKWAEVVLVRRVVLTLLEHLQKQLDVPDCSFACRSLNERGD